MNPRRILFLDDEQRVLSGLRRMLHAARQRWTPSFAATGEEALGQIEREPFDAVVSDLRMLPMDGLTFLEEVRRRRPGVIRVVLSAFAPRLTVFRVMACAHRFIVKPCDSDAIISMIDRLLALSDAMSDAMRRTILELDHLPVPTDIYQALSDALALNPRNLAGVRRVMAVDPILAAGLFRYAGFIVTSPPTQAPTDIHGLLSTLSDTEAHDLMAEGLYRTPAGTDPCAPLYGAWSRAAAGTAAIAATRAGDDERYRRQAYTAGLLHNIGKWVLAASSSGRSGEPSRPAGGEEGLADGAGICGATQADAGAHLLGWWGLPDAIVEAVRLQHASGNAPPLARLLHEIVTEAPA